MNEPFKNMQHAIVEALHELGANSIYEDGSVRMRDVFSYVENLPILVNGVSSNGPHRYPVFNSAITGRRSSSMIFERVESESRNGVWFRLKIPYEEALQLAQAQKGMKQHLKRNKEPQSSNQESFVAPYRKSHQHHLKSFEKVSMLMNEITFLKDENNLLISRRDQLKSELLSFHQNALSEDKERIAILHKMKTIEKELHNTLDQIQKILAENSEKAKQAVLLKMSCGLVDVQQPKK